MDTMFLIKKQTRVFYNSLREKGFHHLIKNKSFKGKALLQDEE